MFKKIKLALLLRKLWKWAMGQNWKGEFAMPEVANGVPIKPASKSWINWTAGIAVLASILSLFGIEVTAEQQVQIQVGITAVSSVIIAIFRTFKNNTVTKAPE